LRTYPFPLDLVRERSPERPVALVRPRSVSVAARWFQDNLNADVFYAVKANPSRWVIETLVEAGVTGFDVASLAEIELVRSVSADARLAFMHPVKSRGAITRAYFEYGVRTFSLDSMDELDKIVRATDGATDLTLCVRLRVSSEHSKLSLASKFGADPSEVRELLIATRQVADALGICFHVGSQAMTPSAYVEALERVRAAIVSSGVTVDVIDVGGGFPSVYPGMEPPALEAYFDAIARAYESLPVSYSSELWCEPGRALCAEYSSLIVRVEKRRGDELYINDGAYGALFDAAHVGWRFPVALLREEASDTRDMAFSFYGPTCDDMDHMAGPFLLPADIQAGDYIEIGMLGAYGCAMRTGFNGFTNGATHEVSDAPMATLYGEDADEALSARVVKL